MSDVETSFNNLTISKSDNQIIDNEGDKWNFPLKELYRHTLSFYKEKEGKALHLSYEDKLKLVAFTLQANHGSFDTNKLPPLGVLDVIGRDRRLAWAQLGNLSKAQAMEGFIDLLDRLCPLLKPYTEAIKKDKEEKERLANEAEKQKKIDLEQEKVKQEKERSVHEEQMRQEMQSRKIKDALNQQTYYQFRAYAEQQYPGNPDQQAILIRQLQEQHYYQYMQQLHYNQQTSTPLLDSKLTDNKSETNEEEQNSCMKEEMNESPQEKLVNSENEEQIKNDVSDNEQSANSNELIESDAESQSDYLSISTASMWTRSDLKVFKQAVSCGEGDGVIRVGHGETVTVRVPTHDGGTCLFWEFATDTYDIGFGVYFEWSKSPTNQVSVHISESDEDDELDENDDLNIGDDLESGSLQNLNAAITPSTRPPLSIIVPVYRRDCQNEVYAGSHVYPGEGVYLLKFDNSYSLWRGKTLYYRVYYTR